MILVSGITGFVGKNLQNYFANTKYKIFGLSRAENKSQNIDTYKKFSEVLLNKAIAFIHLAGKAHDLKNTSKEETYFEANTEFTKKMFSKFLKSNCKIFIYMSSVKAVADKTYNTLKETIKPNPITAYGKSKLAAEEYLLKQKLPENKKLYILRPCMIHGPNNKGNLNLLYLLVSKGIPYPFGKYKNKRSFLSVENLCFIIKELIENKTIDSGIYNVADDQPLSTIEIIQIIGEVKQKTVKVLNFPKKIVNTISKIGDLINLPINTERLEKLTENYCVSNAKIKKAIKKQLPLTATEGMKKTITSFL